MDALTKTADHLVLLLLSHGGRWTKTAALARRAEAVDMLAWLVGVPLRAQPC